MHAQSNLLLQAGRHRQLQTKCFASCAFRKEEVEEDVLGRGAETGSALTRGGDDAAAGRGDGRAALDGEADGGAGQGGHGGDAGEEMEGGADWA